jgi:hypothetical protein
MLLGVKRAIALAITQATGLPQCDRSSDRNDQHRDTLQHHPANAAYPRHAVRAGTCMHLLIAGLLVQVQLGEPNRRPAGFPGKFFKIAPHNIPALGATHWALIGSLGW